MNRIKEINVLTVTFHTPGLIKSMIQSFEKFKPRDFNITYVIVENSSDMSYKDQTLSLAENIVWINHPEGENHQSSHGHGMAFDIGKKECKQEYTFVCHSDTCVTSTSFFKDFFKKVDDGFDLVGVCYDAHPDRIKAIHCSGYLTKTEILNSTTMLPDLPKYDTTDFVTKYCRDNKIKIHVFENTYNEREINSQINEPFRSWGPGCGVDRCVNEKREVIFMHLGRGTSKQQNTYRKAGKMNHSQWIQICDIILHHN